MDMAWHCSGLHFIRGEPLYQVLVFIATVWRVLLTLHSNETSLAARKFFLLVDFFFGGLCME